MVPLAVQLVAGGAVLGDCNTGVLVDTDAAGDADADVDADADADFVADRQACALLVVAADADAVLVAGDAVVVEVGGRNEGDGRCQPGAAAEIYFLASGDVVVVVERAEHTTVVVALIAVVDLARPLGRGKPVTGPPHQPLLSVGSSVGG